jgi:hypothetical protein
VLVLAGVVLAGPASGPLAAVAVLVAVVAHPSDFRPGPTAVITVASGLVGAASAHGPTWAPTPPFLRWRDRGRRLGWWVSAARRWPPSGASTSAVVGPGGTGGRACRASGSSWSPAAPAALTEIAAVLATTPCSWSLGAPSSRRSKCAFCRVTCPKRTAVMMTTSRLV